MGRDRPVEQRPELLAPSGLAFAIDGHTNRQHDVEAGGASRVKPERLAGDAAQSIAIDCAGRLPLGERNTEARIAPGTPHDVEKHRFAADLSGRAEEGREGLPAREAMAPGKASLPGAADHARVRRRRACGPWRGGH